MKKIYNILLLLIAVITFNTATAQKTSVLVVRGGHPYDTPDFEKMCNKLKGVKADLVLDAHFKSMKIDAITKKYDAILFMNQNKYFEESKRTKKLYADLTKAGVGMVFMHFTLSSQPNWDEYHKIVGGKWHLGKFTKDKKKRSTYYMNMTVDAKVVDPKHPVTKGIKDFKMTDTFYGNITTESDLIPLVTTTENKIHKAIVWTHTYNKSKVVYIMPGFTKKAYTNKSYKKLVANSLKFVGK